jgi:hypothetical protein
MNYLTVRPELVEGETVNYDTVSLEEGQEKKLKFERYITNFDRDVKTKGPMGGQKKGGLRRPPFLLPFR